MPKYHRQFGIPFSRIHEDRDLTFIVPLKPRLLVGLVGLKLAGKRRVSNYLVEEQGFRGYSLAQALREMASALAIPIVDRSVLQDFGDELRRRRGKDCLARHVVRQMYTDVVEHGVRLNEVVISGIKNCGEVEALSKIPNFFLVAVTATTATRHQRGEHDGVFKGRVEDWEEKIDERDRQFADQSGQQVGLCIERAAYRIENDGTIEELMRRCSTMLELLRGEARKRAI